MGERASEVRTLLATLALGGLGAAAVAATGLPAGSLVGSSLAVAAAAALGVRVALPTRLRDIAFAVIGVSLGSGVSAETLGLLGPWLASLAMLALSIAVTLVTGAMLLRSLFDLGRDTAVLSSSPGTMSYALAISLDGRGDPAAIMVLQTTRLLLLVTTVPVIAALLGQTVPEGPDGVRALSLFALGVLILFSLGTGEAGRRLGLPASFLIGGMVVSALAHILGLARGDVPDWAIFLSFTVTGAVLGARLKSLDRQALFRLSRAGLVLVGWTVLVSLAFAELTALLLGMPFGQVWIAFAPGGVEAMAAIGLALGYDPAYVAVHHFVRIGFLLVFVPFWLGAADR